MSCFLLHGKVRRGLGLFSALAISLASVACGGEITPSGATSSSTSAGTGGAGTGGGGAGGGGTGGSGACSSATLCLDVKLMTGNTVAGRIGVVWFQLSDDGPSPAPLVAYDAPFDPSSTHVEIPLGAIALPNEENLSCKRACTDESKCPCLGDPRIGIGFAMVVADGNVNGKLDVEEIADGMYGWAYMAVAYSEVEQAMLPAPFSGRFPEGVGKGVLPYRVIPKGNGVFDALGRSQPGDVFDLDVCDNAGTQCSPKVPNLT